MNLESGPRSLIDLLKTKALTIHRFDTPLQQIANDQSNILQIQFLKLSINHREHVPNQDIRSLNRTYAMPKSRNATPRQKESLPALLQLGGKDSHKGYRRYALHHNSFIPHCLQCRGRPSSRLLEARDDICQGSIIQNLSPSLPSK